MNAWRCLLPAVCLLSAAHGLQAGALPDDFTANYAVSINNLKIGESEVVLDAQEGGRYLYRSLARSTGIAKLFRGDTVRESSLFILHRDRIRPLEYRFDHTGSKKERHALLNFDWQAQKVSNTVEDHTWEMEIPGDALDKLVVQLAVMMDLNNGKRKLVYAIADGGKLKEYQFAVVGEENVKVPAGEFATVKIQRLRKDNDRTTHFWCAPALGHLPVRIEQIEHEDGVTFLSELKRTSLGGQPAAAGNGAE
ncbi:MAG TPA: DUF3108 domain-containing protein [Gammaproteobacteria bacterium]